MSRSSRRHGLRLRPRCGVLQRGHERCARQGGECRAAAASKSSSVVPVLIKRMILGIASLVSGMGAFFGKSRCAALNARAWRDMASLSMPFAGSRFTRPRRSILVGVAPSRRNLHNSMSGSSRHSRLLADLRNSRLASRPVHCHPPLLARAGRHLIPARYRLMPLRSVDVMSAT